MSEGSGRPPQRVRVTRTVPLRRRVATPDPSPEVVSVYDRALRRTQLRASVLAVLAVLVPLGSLPLLAVLAPGLAAGSVLGVPAAWLVLAVGVYPALWWAGRRHVREAERNEADYRELVEQEPS